MAILWPRELPRDIERDVLRKTECNVFRKLKLELEDDFEVFYSRPWLGLKPDGSEIDGECDFVIAHPSLGILALEVKGGGVACDPATGQWTSRDRWGITHTIKNPVAQARTSKHQLLTKLSQSLDWIPRRIGAQHGIVLPDSSMPQHDLGIDMPREIFCFREDYDKGLGIWIKKRLGINPHRTRQNEELGSDGLRALRMLIARPFQLKVPLGRTLKDDDSEIQYLTRQQFYILEAIAAVKRAAIQGGAGTGKTILAMEEAGRRAEKGNRVLFTCFNRALAEEAKRRMAHFNGITIATFHQLCIDMAERADLRIPDSRDSQEFFEETCPELLLRAMELRPDLRFDGIIVDEGQDFRNFWWVALDGALAVEGVLRVFSDSNQSVYSTTATLPAEVSLIPIRLTLNMRNTHCIHQAVQDHYSGHFIESIGPEGTPVQWIQLPAKEEMIAGIESLLIKLTIREQIPASDIAVLASDLDLIRKLAERRGIAGCPIITCETEPSNKCVTLDSIRRFKGLERPVIIVAATPDLPTEEELVYVAFSRARTLLAIIGHEHVIERLRPKSAHSS